MFRLHRRSLTLTTNHKWMGAGVGCLFTAAAVATAADQVSPFSFPVPGHSYRALRSYLLGLLGGFMDSPWRHQGRRIGAPSLRPPVLLPGSCVLPSLLSLLPWFPPSFLGPSAHLKRNTSRRHLGSQRQRVRALPAKHGYPGKSANRRTTDASRNARDWMGPRQSDPDRRTLSTRWHKPWSPHLPAVRQRQRPDGGYLLLGRSGWIPALRLVVQSCHRPRPCLGLQPKPSGGYATEVRMASTSRRNSFTLINGGSIRPVRDRGTLASTSRFRVTRHGAHQR